MSMNKLPNAKRAQVLQMMAEGIALRAITRLTGISRTTLQKLLEDAGQAFSDYQDRELVNLKCKRIQVDEAWSFCYAKQKNVATREARPGRRWRHLDVGWLGRRHQACGLVLCRRTRWRCGDRVHGRSCAKRLANRVQLTSDGHRAYLEAVEGAFGGDVDYAQLVKTVWPTSESAKGRYSPAECTGVNQDPDRRQARSEAYQHVLIASAKTLTSAWAIAA